jgi:hypothetical protein
LASTTGSAVGGPLTGRTGFGGATAAAGSALVDWVEVVLDFRIFLAAFITVGMSGLRDGGSGAGAGLGFGLGGAGTTAVPPGGGTAWAIPADLGSRSRDFFFAGVDAVFDFITEKPLYRYADFTAGIKD